MRWVSRSAVGSSETFSAAGKTLRAVAHDGFLAFDQLPDHLLGLGLAVSPRSRRAWRTAE